MIFDPQQHAVVFLSYDEPNADSHFRQLQKIRPDALRVHTVKGSDAAHKACAQISPTDRVIIVDGDNLVNPRTFYETIELDDQIDFENSVLSYSGQNIINNTRYGNGGIKCWPRHLLLSMRTHENSDSPSVDFDCTNYLQLNRVGSMTVINASPRQAWRAGFRDGIKLLQSGSGDFVKIDWRNRDRLYSWLHVGSDAINGIWSILGARVGCKMLLDGIDITILNNFDQLNKLFLEYENLNTDQVLDLANIIGKDIGSDFVHDVYSQEQSVEYKQTHCAPMRSPELFLKNPPKQEYDIFFISYQEAYAEKNWINLKRRFPKAKRILDVKGIHQAHIAAAHAAQTDYFWVVDADAEIVSDFYFDFEVPFFDQERVRVWRSRNSVNELVYGNGGVKLLPRVATAKMTINTLDMTTSICASYEPVMQISNINCFNTDEFSAWRSAFRECAKLASQTINNQNTQETQTRLDVWCTTGEDKPFGKYVLQGAASGKLYGLENKHDLKKLSLINNYTWLREQFENQYHI